MRKRRPTWRPHPGFVWRAGWRNNRGTVRGRVCSRNSAHEQPWVWTLTMRNYWLEDVVVARGRAKTRIAAQSAATLRAREILTGETDYEALVEYCSGAELPCADGGGA